MTQDLLAMDHFITHVGCRILHVTLSSAKPATLAAAINLTAELELGNGHLAQDSNVWGL